MFWGMYRAMCRRGPGVGGWVKHASLYTQIPDMPFEDNHIGFRVNLLVGCWGGVEI